MKNQFLARLSAFVLLAGALFAAPGRAQGGASGMPDLSDFAGAIAQKAEVAPPKKAAPTPKEGFSSGLAVPQVKPGEAAQSVGRDFRLKMKAASPDADAFKKMEPSLLALEKAMPEMLVALEKEFSKYGLAPRDMGTAYAFAFLQLHEDATGKVASDTQTKVAARTLSSAIGKVWATKWKTIAPAERESFYEKLIMTTALNSLLIQQFNAAKKSDEVATMRETAAELFQSLVRVAPNQVTIAADGRISGLTTKTEEETPETSAPTKD